MPDKAFGESFWSTNTFPSVSGKRRYQVFTLKLCLVKATWLGTTDVFIFQDFNKNSCHGWYEGSAFYRTPELI